MSYTFRDTPINELFGPIMATLRDLRERFAALINAAQTDEIALMPNTATAINTAALSLPLRPGDNVLLLDGDYPANIYPWMNLAHRGVLTKMVPTSAGGLTSTIRKCRPIPSIRSGIAPPPPLMYAGMPAFS